MPTLQNPRYKILTARTILNNLKKQTNKPGLMAILLWISSGLPLFSSSSGNLRRQREKVHVCACVSVCVCVHERKGCSGQGGDHWGGRVEPAFLWLLLFSENFRE